MPRDDEELIEVKKEEKYCEEYYFRILNKNRYILLYDAITNCSSDLIVSKLRAMDLLNSQKPIVIELNSPGGSVPDGMSIINAIEHIKSPVVTLITGQACSMAALISVVADVRLIYANSYWMQHSTSDIVGDYVQYIKDRTKFLCEFEHRTEKLLKAHTRLSSSDILKIRNGELWLNADQCLSKGIVDKIIEYTPKKIDKSSLKFK